MEYAQLRNIPRAIRQTDGVKIETGQIIVADANGRTCTKQMSEDEPIVRT